LEKLLQEEHFHFKDNLIGEKCEIECHSSTHFNRVTAYQTCSLTG